jgi:hypothetical protein
MKNKTLVIVAIVATTALLIGAAVISQDAFACRKNKGDNSKHQTGAQVCTSQNKCQNLHGQIIGEDIAVNIVGNQP